MDGNRRTFLGGIAAATLIVPLVAHAEAEDAIADSVEAINQQLTVMGAQLVRLDGRLVDQPDTIDQPDTRVIDELTQLKTNAGNLVTIADGILQRRWSQR